MVAFRHHGPSRHDLGVLYGCGPIAILFHVSRGEVRQSLFCGARLAVIIRHFSQGAARAPASITDHDRLSLASARFCLLEKAPPCFRRPSFLDRSWWVVWVRAVAGRIGFFDPANYRGKSRHCRRRLRTLPTPLLFRASLLSEPRALEFFLPLDSYFFVASPPRVISESSGVPVGLAGHGLAIFFLGFGQARGVHPSAFSSFCAAIRRVVGKP